MGKGFKNKEKIVMKCRVCGAKMQRQKSDLPFKKGQRSIVIIKQVPVLQCASCREYLLNDAVMERVEALLDEADTNAELEIVRYAA